MRERYRAVWFKDWMLTSPDQAGLSDAELIETAVAEAYRADIVCKVTDDPEEPRLTEAALRAGLVIEVGTHGLTLLRSDQGDGGWSLHPPRYPGEEWLHD